MNILKTFPAAIIDWIKLEMNSLYYFRGLISIFLLLFSLTVQAQAPVEVIITGVNSEQEENIRLLLSMEVYKNTDIIDSNWIKTMNQRADKEITRALVPFGFYAPSVTRTVEKINDRWRVEYQINPGQPVVLSKVSVNIMGEAINDEAINDWQARFPLKAGDVLNQDVYKKALEQLSDMLVVRGYREAKFSQRRITVFKEQFRAEIDVQLESGQRYQFGPVVFKQSPARFDETFLAGFVHFKAGEPFNSHRLSKLQTDLTNSKYFSRAKIQAFPAEGQQIPVQIELFPAKRISYTAGLGYGTDKGLKLELAMDNWRVNDQGHQYGTNFHIDNIEYQIGGHYRIPWRNPLNDEIVFTSSYTDKDSDSNKSKTWKVGGQLNHSIGKERFGYSLRYEREDFETGSDQGKSHMAIPQFDWLRKSTDRTGSWLSDYVASLRLSGASDRFISDVSFVQLYLSARMRIPLSKHTRLLLRGAFGTTDTDDFNELPSSLRFYAGGTQSVRGFDFEELGPTDSNGDVIGGKHLLSMGMDLVRTIKGKWSASVFFDTGNALNDFGESLEQSAGLGLIYESPIGPIRLYVGQDLSGNKSPRLHFIIGSDF